MLPPHAVVEYQQQQMHRQHQRQLRRERRARIQVDGGKGKPGRGVSQEGDGTGVGWGATGSVRAKLAMRIWQFLPFANSYLLPIPTWQGEGRAGRKKGSLAATNPCE